MKSSKASTYSLLVRAEEAEASRNVFEAAVYGLFLVAAVITMWQVALSTATLPTKESGRNVKIAQAASAQQPS